MSEDSSRYPLFTTPLFPVTTPAEGRRWLTLREMLALPAPDARISHPYAYLDMVYQSLAAALTQLLFNGSDLQPSARQAVVEDQLPLSDELLDALFADAEKLQGFDLLGTSAFLQVPRPLLVKKLKGGVVHLPAEPISGLFSPFLSRSSEDSTAKGLRQLVHMDYCCPACATAGVMSTQLFSPSMAQYWGRSQTSGSLYFWLSVEGPFSLGRSVFANMAPKQALEDQDDEMFPWVADNAERNGLDAAGYPPFARLFESDDLLEATIYRQLPFVRGVRLDNPVSRDRVCDLCGQVAPWGFKQFYLMPEPMLREALPAGRGPVDAKGKPAAAGILSRRVEPNVRHPALAYAPRKTKAPVAEDFQSDDDTAQGAFLPVSQRQDAANVDGLRPTWINVEGMLGEMTTANRPLVLQQMAVFSRHVTSYQLTVFAVNAESSTNPNPHSVISEQYGISALAGATPEIEMHLKAVLQGIQQAIETQIGAWLAAAEIFGYDTEQQRRKSDGELVLVTKRPVKARYMALKNSVKTEGALREYGRQLWDLGLQYVSLLLDDKVPQSTADIMADATRAITHQGFIFWQDYLRQKTPPSPDIRELFLVSTAKAVYRNKCR